VILILFFVSALLFAFLFVLYIIAIVWEISERD
jgi:hypothetical protein